MTVFLLYMISPIFWNIVFRLRGDCSEFVEDSIRRKLTIVLSFELFLMIGLRSFTIGSGDSAIYFQNWKYLSSIPLKTAIQNSIFQIDMEKGYLFLVAVLSHIFSNPQFLFIFSGAFFAVAIGSFCYKNCDDVMIGFLAINCLGLFNFIAQGLRQGVAICICLLAFEFCKSRKLIPFILMIALAMSFHASAFVFVIVYFLYGMEINWKNIILIIVGLFAAVFSIDKIMAFGNMLMNDSYSVNTELTEGGYFTIAIYCVIIFFSILYSVMYSFELEKDCKVSYDFYILVAIISATSFMLRYSVSTIAERVSFYYIAGLAVILCRIPYLFANNQKHLVKLAIVFMCIFVAYHKATYSPLVPYLFFWQV